MSRPVLGSAARSTHATHTARQHPPATPNSSRESPLSAQQATSLAPAPRASATRLSPGRNTVSLPRQTHTTRAVCCAPGALIQGCTGKRICATSEATPVPMSPNNPLPSPRTLRRCRRENPGEHARPHHRPPCPSRKPLVQRSYAAAPSRRLRSPALPAPCPFFCCRVQAYARQSLTPSLSAENSHESPLTRCI